MNKKLDEIYLFKYDTAAECKNGRDRRGWEKRSIKDGEFMWYLE